MHMYYINAYAVMLHMAARMAAFDLGLVCAAKPTNNSLDHSQTAQIQTGETCARTPDRFNNVQTRRKYKRTKLPHDKVVHAACRFGWPDPLNRLVPVPPNKPCLQQKALLSTTTTTQKATTTTVVTLCAYCAHTKDIVITCGSSSPRRKNLRMPCDVANVSSNSQSDDGGAKRVNATMLAFIFSSF